MGAVTGVLDDVAAAFDAFMLPLAPSVALLFAALSEETLEEGVPDSALIALAGEGLLAAEVVCSSSSVSESATLLFLPRPEEDARGRSSERREGHQRARELGSRNQSGACRHVPSLSSSLFIASSSLPCSFLTGTLADVLASAFASLPFVFGFLRALLISDCCGGGLAAPGGYFMKPLRKTRGVGGWSAKEPAMRRKLLIGRSSP